MSAENLIIENGVVKGIKGESAHIIIPEGITEIGECAFADSTCISDVTIDSSVFRTIGKNAFSGCTSLEKITIKSLNGGIGTQAFYNCPKLGCVDIPSGAMEIGSDAFGLCPGLYLVRIPDSVMVIAADAFNALTSKMLLLVCKPNTDAEKYANEHNIPYRNNFQFQQVSNTLVSANNRRKLVGTRTFDLFGQNIVAPNSIALKESVIEYYKRKEDAFFSLVFGKLPQRYGGNSEINRIGEDFFHCASETVTRLEKHGVYTTQLRVLRNAGQILNTLVSTLKSISEIINELSVMRNSHLNDRMEQLRYEAESKVTGLSYGVIGDSLTLALHAVDDFRARQKQRSEAYAVAQKQYDQETAQTNATINENYKKILHDNISPVIRTLTDAFMNTLCAAEISHLVDYGLLEDVDLTTYDAKKSSEILSRSASTSAEYAIGLALKTYPLNTKALVLAGSENYATDDILDYITFMQIKDSSVIKDILKSKKITLSALIRFHNSSAAIDVCKQEIKTRTAPVQEKIDTLACGKNKNSTAADFQKQISELIDYDLWIASNRIEPILSEPILKKLELTQQEATTEKGYLSLGQRIYAYNDKFTHADAQAESVIASDATIQEKIAAVYELREILGAQKGKQLLFDDLTQIGERLLQEDIPEYTGFNFEAIRKSITQKIEIYLGSEIVSKLNSMHLTGLDATWPGALTAQYINTKKSEYLQKLSDKLQSVKDYREAFDTAKQYEWSIERSDLRHLMKKYTDEATDKLNRFADVLDIPESAKETEAKELAINRLYQLMPEECWIVYCLCSSDVSTNPGNVMDRLESAVYAKAEQIVRNEIIYREACAAANIAKNASAVEVAQKRFENIAGDYKDTAKKIAECEERIAAYTKKKNTIATTIGISVTAAIIAVVILFFTYIIPNNNYSRAEQYLAEGKISNAAIMFGKTGNYKDAQARSFALWNQVAVREYIGGNEYHIIGLKSDGTLVGAGSGEYGKGKFDVPDWKDIIAIADDYGHIAGLKSDGTVVSSGGNLAGQCNVSGWTDIVAIDVSAGNTVGLKSDGTVVAVGNNLDGACNVSGWKNIVAISAGTGVTVGLKANGTVVAAGDNDHGQCNVKDWTDIVSICAGSGFTVGLKSNGTVVAVGRNTKRECNVSSWKDIIAISAGTYHTVGLKSDGTVVAVGDNSEGQCNVSGWTDIIAVSATEKNTIGLKSDGTIVVAGNNEYGQCDVHEWKNIKIPG